LIVRFWNAHERVYTPNGRIEPYRPEVQSLRPLRRLAARTPGGQLFGEGELKQAVAAARAWLGHGPSRRIGRPRRFELAPYAALAAVLPIAFLLRRRDP
jgi:hypothetical protein